MENTERVYAMNEELQQKILEENILLHRIEAPQYEVLHPEEFNWFEQGRIVNDISFILERLPPKAKVLDLGCGTGNISLKILSAGLHEIQAVDISKEMLEELKRKILSAGEDRIKLFSQNIDDFVSRCAEKFDLITISSVLHHLPEYLSTLNKSVRLLNPEGWLYITHEPTKQALGRDPFLRKILWQIDSLLYSGLHRTQLKQTDGRNFHMSDYHLYQGFDEEKVIHECKDTGLRIVRFARYASTMRLGISCWIDTCILRSKRQFVLIAKKGLRKERLK